MDELNQEGLVNDGERPQGQVSGERDANVVLEQADGTKKPGPHPKMRDPVQRSDSVQDTDRK